MARHRDQRYHAPAGSPAATAPREAPGRSSRRRFAAVLYAGALLLTGLVLAACGGGGNGGSNLPSGSGIVATQGPPEILTAKIGEQVHIGDIELTVSAAEAFNASQHNPSNDENFIVKYKVVNTKPTTEARLTTSSWKVIDKAGATHEPAFGCSGCPIAPITGGSTLLRGGGTFESAVYFKLPADAELASLIYQPPFSQSKVTFTP